VFPYHYSGDKIKHGLTVFPSHRSSVLILRFSQPDLSGWTVTA